MRKIKTLLFDLDGVLIDSLDDAVDCLNYTFRALGLKEKGRSEIQTYLGPGDTHLVLQGIGEENNHLLENALVLYRERYRAMCLNKTALCPGVEEVLDYFRDKNLAVITNKPEDMARYVLEGLKVAHYFKFIWGPESVKNRKPHPEALNKLRQAFGTEKEETLMVGDTDTDIQAGKAAGIITCAVTYGFGDAAALAALKADYTVDSLAELKKLFC